MEISEAHLDSETQLVLADAEAMVKNQPIPTFGADLPDEFRNAMILGARQHVYSNAVMLASVKRSLMQAMDNAVVQVRAELKQSNEETKTHLRQEFKVAGEIVTKRFDQTDQRLDQVDDRLEEMQRVMASNDSITQAWTDANNVHLRQVIAWILFFGLDTACEFGMTPLFHFAYLADRPQTEENHVTVISKALLRMLVMHRSKFSPAVINGLQTKVEHLITPVFKCLTNLSQQQMREFAAVFPCKLYMTGSIYVLRTTHLVRLMKEELKQFQQGHGVLDTTADFRVESTVDADGRFDIQEGINMKEKKSILSKFRDMIGVGPEQLRTFSEELLFKNEEPDIEALESFVATRRVWGLPASYEYMELPSTRTGIQMVLRGVFNRDLPANHQPFHLGKNWTVDTEGVPQPFLDIISDYNDMEPEEFTRIFRKEEEEEEEKKPKAKGKGRKKAGRKPKPKAPKRKQPEPEEEKVASPPSLPLQASSSSSSSSSSSTGEVEMPKLSEAITVKAWPPGAKRRKTKITSVIPDSE